MVMDVKTEEPKPIIVSGMAVGQTDFDAVADAYDDSLPFPVMAHYKSMRVAMIMRHAPTGGKVLDVGCGTGVLAETLVAVGYDVTGLDPFQGMLRHLKQRVPSITTVQGNGEALPFPDNTFDFTYCVAVMHHVAGKPNVRQTLKEMVRVTKPGGKIMIWDHNPRNPYWPLLMKRVPQDTGAERLIPDREIRAGLAAGGAITIFNRPLGLMPDFTPTGLIPTMARVESLVEKVPLVRLIGAHNVIVAIKEA
jgi:SAM-dependent methyltransferase